MITPLPSRDSIASDAAKPRGMAPGTPREVGRRDQAQRPPYLSL